jgi:hypothetical protein
LQLIDLPLPFTENRVLQLNSRGPPPRGKQIHVWGFRVYATRILLMLALASSSGVFLLGFRGTSLVMREVAEFTARTIDAAAFRKEAATPALSRLVQSGANGG